MSFKMDTNKMAFRISPSHNYIVSNCEGEGVKKRRGGEKSLAQ